MSDATSMVEYRDVQGYPGYRIGSDGTVWSSRRFKCKTQWCLMKQVQRQAGKKYLSVSMRCDSGKSVSVTVHRLVLLAFTGECPSGFEARHLDGNAANNRAENLRWGTRQENNTDRHVHNNYARLAGELNPSAKLSAEKVKQLRDRRNESATRLCCEFQISLSQMYRIRSGASWAIIPD